MGVAVAVVTSDAHTRQRISGPYGIGPNSVKDGSRSANGLVNLRMHRMAG